MSANDARSLRCVGKDDTTFLTFSKSIRGVVIRNKLFPGEYTVSVDGRVASDGKVTSRHMVKFEPDAVVIDVAFSNGSRIRMEIDRRTLFMSAEGSTNFLGFPLPVGETFECTPISTKKQL